MPPGLRARAAGMMIAAATALAGCGSPEQPVIAGADARDIEIRLLKNRLELVQAEAAALQGQVQDLRSRDEQLVATIRQLQADNRRLQDEANRLADQVRVLAPAPADRDRYKARAEALSVYVLRLEGEVERLGGKLPLPGTPATPPAARTDGEKRE